MTASRRGLARARFVVCALVAVGLAAVAFVFAGGGIAAQTPAQIPPDAQQPVFRAGANLVLVDAYPQRNGRVVEGLTANDFQVFEDGKPQKIDSFEFVRIEPGIVDSARRDPNTVREMTALAGNPHNRVFITFLDTTHTTIEGGHRIRQPLVDTLDRIIGADDLFGVMTQDMRPNDIALGRRMVTVDEELSKYWFWGEKDRITTDRADPMEFALEQCFGQPTPNGTSLSATLIDRLREDRTLTSLENLVKYVGGIREARTVVIAITDGWLLYGPDEGLAKNGTSDGAGMVPFVPLKPTGGILSPSQSMDNTTCNTEVARLAGLDDAKRLRDLTALAARNNVSFYPVSAGGLMVFDSSIANPLPIATDARQIQSRLEGLRTLAENTGGIAVLETNDLAAGVKRIADDVSAYYLLTYYSTNPKFDGSFRKIDVKMQQAGLTVHARRGYLAPSSAPRAGMAATATAAPAAATVDVRHALDGLSRLTESGELYTFAASEGGELSVVVDLASRLVGSSDWAKGGKVSVTVSTARGESVGAADGVLDSNGRSVVVRVPTGASAGPWSVTAVLTAPGARVDDRVDAAADRSALLGAPLVYRATPAPRSPLVPVADLEFRRTERVHVEWPALKALDQRTARLLDRRGQALPVGAAITEREVDGKPAVAVDVNLAPLAEGDYVIEVDAGSGAETEQKLIAFRLVR